MLRLNILRLAAFAFTYVCALVLAFDHKFQPTSSLHLQQSGCMANCMAGTSLQFYSHTIIVLACLPSLGTLNRCLHFAYRERQSAAQMIKLTGHHTASTIAQFVCPVLLVAISQSLFLPRATRSGAILSSLGPARKCDLPLATWFCTDFRFDTMVSPSSLLF